MSAGPLDVLSLPVNGTQFIEAGAGTGKTHTISNLFVRLVVETGRSVESILVLTFTRAATAELRERIQSRLRQLANALRGGAVPADDDFAVDLLARINDVGLVQRRLDLALAGFDAAPIHTIHGFCQRALSDHALLSRSVFAAEMLEDEGELRRQIARDFWRRELHGAGRLFVEYLTGQLAGDPEALLAGLGRFLAKPYLIVRGGDQSPACGDIEQAFETAFLSASQAWQSGRAEVAAMLIDGPALSRTKYKVASVRKWLAAVDRLFGHVVEPTLALPAAIGKFTRDSLAEAVKKGHQPPEHPFFNRCATLLKRRQDLADCFRAQCLALQRRFIAYCDEQLHRRKHATGVQSFDDMLNNLHAALCGANREALRVSLRGQYSAALIDEFQDTDPQQYEIFRAIYEDTDLPVYLVGDPKQAIYAFRGADVYAYLRARREIGGATHALTVNWRSDPLLIDAVNAVFMSATAPFRDAQIAFHPAMPAPRARAQLLIDGRAPTPFQIWMIARDDQERLLNKGEAAACAAEATAGEIARLLSGDRTRHALRPAGGGEPVPLSGRDIAVLVRTNLQGQQIRRALTARGIDSVELADASVFDSIEAEELTHVLRAVESPGDDGCIRTALATGMLRDADLDLFSMMQDAPAWEQLVLRFDGYHQLWREQGFFAMWQRLLDAEGVLQRLLARAGGARRVTNLTHLVELMQSESAGGRGGIARLIDWLVDKRLHRAVRDEEAMMRLESDAELVRIVTIHRSKGLEYPIVFCPYLWDDNSREADAATPVYFHDPASDDAPTLQLDGSDPAAIARAEEEARAEAMRVMYVALTRARHLCCMVWGAIRSAQYSSPAWLLHRHRRPHPDDAAFGSWFESCRDADFQADLQALAAQVPGAIAIVPPPVAITSGAPATGPAVALAAREFRGAISRPWRLLSYSTMVRRANEARPDHDDGVLEAVAGTPAAEAVELAGMFGFPRGARAGSCLHAVFEHIDFTDPDGWPAVVSRELARHGFNAEWRATLLDMLGEVMATPLGRDGPRLATVATAHRINELEFHYPFRRFDGSELARLLAPYDPDHSLQRQLRQLEAERLGGYMKGFIDMVFESNGRWYVVDYKSNWLGGQRQDYAPERLAEVMIEETYGLQYLIYVLALHRMLRQRLPGYDYERQMGGVFYLFVRAIAPLDDAGVFADRPPFELVRALDDYLHRGAAS